MNDKWASIFISNSRVLNESHIRIEKDLKHEKYALVSW